MVATYKEFLSHDGVITNQGGEAYQTDVLSQLRRFLILGSEDGTFYVNEKKLTSENVEVVKKALDEFGTQAVDEIVNVSQRAPKNDPALLALAMAAAHSDVDVRRYALNQLPNVARIPTHLFHFVEYVTKMRGWGKSLRRAVANWYLEKTPKQLAYQTTKYVQRDGWSNADLLRLSHPIAKDETTNSILKYIVDGIVPFYEDDAALEYLDAVEDAKASKNVDRIVSLIQNYDLPREVLPTASLNDARVWDALLVKMPLTAMIRNLGVMSSVELLNPNSDAQRTVIDRLQNREYLKRSHVHPIDVLKAKMTYEQGHGTRSDKSWPVNQAVVDALEDAFYRAFENVEPTNKRLLLALDVSGSMTWGEWGNGGLAGVNGLSPRIASAVMAMVTARTEPNYTMMAFSSDFVPLKVSRHDSLETVMTKITNLPFSGTDCALPMVYAQSHGIDVDAFIVYTDSETGGRDPMHALRSYRQASGIHDAKLIVNAMEASYYTVGDPRDPNVLNAVGFDSALPTVMADFIRGEI